MSYFRKNWHILLVTDKGMRKLLTPSRIYRKTIHPIQTEGTGTMLPTI